MPTPGQLRVREHATDLLTEYLPTRPNVFAPAWLEKLAASRQEQVFLTLAERLERDPIITQDDVTGSQVIDGTGIEFRGTRKVDAGAIAAIKPATTFIYSQLPNPLRFTVKPRDPAKIYAAYFGGEKWRTTMWALLEIAAQPQFAKVESAFIDEERGILAHGSDGTHRLLAAFLWGAEHLKGTEAVSNEFITK